MDLGLGLAIGSRHGVAAWNPSSASVPLRGWYKSDVGFTGGGAWLDQSGHTNNFAAQSGGFTASGTLNGRQTIINTGWLNVAAFTLGSAGAISMAIVMKVNTTGTLKIVGDYTNAAFDDHGFGFDGAVATPGFTHNSSTNSADGTTNLHGVWSRVVFTDIAGGNQNLYVNGGASEASQVCVGAIADGLSMQLAAPLLANSLTVAELIVYAGVLSASDRSNLDAYFKSAWNL